MSAITEESEAAERSFGMARVGRDFLCATCEYPFPFGWANRVQDDDGGEFCSEECRRAAWMGLA